MEHNWELIKNAEREALQRSGTVSVVDDVPRALPAIERAGKLQKRAASVGFDWPDVSGVTAKLAEESAELQAAIASDDQNQQTHELGDLLFTCVNLARHLKIDPEGALRQANQRFETRFRYVEKSAASHGARLSDCDPEQLDLWWNEAKSQNN